MRHVPSHDGPIHAFLRQALVPREGAHTSCELSEALRLEEALSTTQRADLFVAATRGDAAAVRAAVTGAPETAHDVGGPYAWDALTHLCFSRFLRGAPERNHGFVEAARVLLAAGANAQSGFFDAQHEPSPMWESVLYGAAAVGRHPGVTRVLLEYGADPNDGETPYHLPESYDLTVMRLVVESGRLTQDSLATMLLRKIDFHDLEGIRYLLGHGADPNRMTTWPVTALHHAIRRDNHVDIVTQLLDVGADITRPSPQYARTGLQWAAQRGRADVLRACAQRGIAPLTGDDALLAACALGDGDAARAIAADAPETVARLLMSGARYLAEFAGNDCAAGVRLLVELGVPVDALYPDGDHYFGVPAGSRALHVAAWRGRHDAVRALLELGADVRQPDPQGRTPLMLAVRACVDSYWMHTRRPDSVALLLRAGASPAEITLPSGYPEIDELLSR